jgi:hypothetical protein
MTQWQYRVEKIAHPLTPVDAQMELSLRPLRDALHPQPDSKFFERDLGHLIRGESGGSAEERLNELGRDGWELVSIYPDNGNAVAIFKRTCP